MGAGKEKARSGSDPARGGSPSPAPSEASAPRNQSSSLQAAASLSFVYRPQLGNACHLIQVPPSGTSH